MSILRALLESMKKLASVLAPRLYVRARARFRSIVGPRIKNTKLEVALLEARVRAFERRVESAAREGRLEARVADRLREFARDARADLAEDATRLR